jgi:hypothetical protein
MSLTGASRTTALADLGEGGDSNVVVATSAVAAYEQQRSVAVSTAGGTWAMPRQSTSGAATPTAAGGGLPSPSIHFQHKHVRQSHSGGIGSGGSPRSRVGVLSGAESPAGGSDLGTSSGGPILGNHPLMHWSNKSLSPRVGVVNPGELTFAEGGAFTRRKSVVGDVNSGGLSAPTNRAFERGKERYYRKAEQQGVEWSEREF